MRSVRACKAIGGYASVDDVQVSLGANCSVGPQRQGRNCKKKTQEQGAKHMRWYMWGISWLTPLQKATGFIPGEKHMIHYRALLTMSAPEIRNVIGEIFVSTGFFNLRAWAWVKLVRWMSQ